MLCICLCLSSLLERKQHNFVLSLPQVHGHVLFFKFSLHFLSCLLSYTLFFGFVANKIKIII